MPSGDPPEDDDDPPGSPDADAEPWEVDDEVGLGGEAAADDEAALEIDDVGAGDPDGDDADLDHALHCPHHGWHPALLEVLLRLRLLGGEADDPDARCREVLAAAGAREVDAHLVGPLSDALAALRAAEARALEAMLA